MKEKILFILLIAGIIYACGRENYYTREATLAYVESDGEYVFEDAAGNLWGFYSTKEIKVGDTVRLEMYDNHTRKIWDDEVVSVKLTK